MSVWNSVARCWATHGQETHVKHAKFLTLTFADQSCKRQGFHVKTIHLTSLNHSVATAGRTVPSLRSTAVSTDRRA